MTWRLSNATGKRLTLLLGAAGVMILPLAGLSQVRVIRGVRDGVVEPAANEPQQGVYVRDSAVATDKFELGKRMERLKEWYKSADVYQEILEKYQDRVIPVATNEKGQFVKYASVTVAVQERLARWPEEGLAVYRTRYEPAAAMLLEQARYDDYRALHDILSRYFVTEAARQAGIRLMDLYLESGEFMAATWIGQRLLEWHPNLAGERPRVIFRTALAYHLAGQPGAAAKLLEELKGKHPNEVANMAGREVSLVEALAKQLRQPAPVAAAQADDSWPMFGGDASRSLIPIAAGVPGARVYTVDLPGPNVEGLNEQAKRAMLDAHNQAKAQGAAVNVMPVADRGQLFFQDGFRVYAMQLESGVPLPGWAQTYGGSHAGQFWLPAGPNAFFNMMGMEQWQFAQTLVPRQQSLTVTDDAVLAVMGQPPLRFQLGPVPVQDAGTRLVCLDRATGRQRWFAGPRTAAADQANARNLSFSGSPLVVGDSVYIIARGSSAAGVEDCHVCCFGLADGQYRWSSYVASSQSGLGNMGGMQMTGDVDALSHLAFASGRVYVLTNLGALAAIDAYSGATAWLTIYPRDERAIVAANQRQMMMGGWGWNPGMAQAANSDDLKPWEQNPVIVNDGQVFVLPSDGKYILVYNAGSGEEIKRIPREIEYSGSNSMRLTMLLAVMGEKLIAAARDGVVFLDWTKADPVEPGSRKLNDAATLYRQTSGIVIKGRPFVTNDQVYVPDESSLLVISIPRTKVVLRFPKDPAKWAPEEGPGNVLVTRDHVVVAGANGVNVYTDLAAVRQKYMAAVQADPGNVEARLLFSELMFNANEATDARRAMDEAIQVLGGLNAMRPGTLRDRVFNDAMLFAQRIGARKDGKSTALAVELFDRAAAAAQNASQQVNYRLGRAAFIESRETDANGDRAMAVRLYQEILSSPEMRAVPLSGTDGVALTAGKKAETAITGLIAKVGPALYAPFERKAASALSALAGAKDPAALLALADEYPHSSAAPQSLMQAAMIYQNTAQPRLATIVLRRLYWRYQQRYSGQARAELAEAIARNYLATGNIGAALGRLQRISSTIPGAKLSGPLAVDDKPLLTRDGRTVQTLQEAVDSLHLLATQRSAELLPDVNLPLPLTVQERLARKKLTSFEPTAGMLLANVQSIPKPPIDLPESARYDRLVVWSEGKLICLPAGRIEALWTSAALTREPLGLAWLEKKVLVWSAGEAALLDGEGGEILWRIELKGLPPAPPLLLAGADETPPVPVQAAELQRRVLLERQMIMRVRGGIAVPGNVNVPVEALVPAGPERILHLRPLSDRVIITTSNGRVFAADLNDGQLIWQTRAAQAAGIQQTLANDDFTVLRIVESPQAQLLVLDSYNGQPAWRKRLSQDQGTWLVNAALSADGMLVWTTQQSIVAKDLYDPGDNPTWERRGQTFAGMLQADQIAIFGQEVFAVCNSGQLIMRCSLRRGEPTRDPINTQGSDAATRLRLSGPRLYIIGTRSVIAHHLEDGTSVPIQLNSDVTSMVSDSMLTKHYLLLPGMVMPAAFVAPRDGDAYSLQAYSRTLIRNSETGKRTESGLQVHRYDFAEAAKIKAWQAVEGGVYYLGGDGKLRFLRGTRK